MRKLLAVWCVGVALCACSWAETNPVGTWKGGFHGEIAKLPGKPDAQSQKALTGLLETMRSMHCTLKVKANHTFTMDIVGTRLGKPENHRTEGTWKVVHGIVVTISLKRDRKVLGNAEQTKNQLTMSKDGKTLERPYTTPIKGAIVLKRV